MADHRLSRKDIRGPDQFLSTSLWFIHWIQQHTRHLLYSALGVLLLIGLAALWFTWQKHQEQQAEALFYEAKKLLSVNGRIAEEAERARAKGQLEKLVRDYASSSSAGFAHWYLGQMAFEERDYTKALEAYRHAQQKFSRASNALMSAAATLASGYAQEASGICDQAVTSFETVLQSTAHWLRGEAYLGLGRCYEKIGSQDKAAALAERVKADKNLSELARQNIAEQLTFLEKRTREHTS